MNTTLRDALSKMLNGWGCADEDLPYEECRACCDGTCDWCRGVQAAESAHAREIRALMAGLPAAVPLDDDWTRDEDGRSNSSPIFQHLCGEVERLIRGEAASLIAGQAGTVAGLIMAQLAHVHGLRPGTPPADAAGEGLPVEQSREGA